MRQRLSAASDWTCRRSCARTKRGAAHVSRSSFEKGTPSKRGTFRTRAWLQPTVRRRRLQRPFWRVRGQACRMPERGKTGILEPSPCLTATPGGLASRPPVSDKVRPRVQCFKEGLGCPPPGRICQGSEGGDSCLTGG